MVEDVVHRKLDLIAIDYYGEKFSRSSHPHAASSDSDSPVTVEAV